MPGDLPELAVEALDRAHDRASFECGEQTLDRYLREQAMQDMRRRANGVFVLVRPADRERILGYYTLAAIGLEPGAIPGEARKHLPRYPQVSATLLGRLAVARDRQGEGLGALLLVDALRRAYDSAAVIGSCMVVVDSLGEAAARFYRNHGFIALADSSRMLLPMRTIGRLLDIR